MPDQDGYPTEEELEFIKNYDIVNSSLENMFVHIKSIWRWSNLVKFVDGRWYISTGGWSGNEDIIGAMKQNTTFWLLYWEQSRRGGHYIFSKQRMP